MKLTVVIYLVGLVSSLAGMGSASLGSGKYGFLIYFAALCLLAGMYLDRRQGSDVEESVPNN